MYDRDIDALVGKYVVVRANGFDYRGKLLEIAPDCVTLRRITSYTAILTDRIVSIKLLEEPTT